MEEPISRWNDEKRREYFRAYRRSRKAEFKSRGICPNCQKNPSAAGKVCCTQCLEDKKLTTRFGTAAPYRFLYSDLFERQQGLCGICKQSMMRPVLDYSHSTMVVRGLLCSTCNIGLGQFRDDPNLLRAAIYYVENNAGIGIEIKKRKQ